MIKVLYRFLLVFSLMPMIALAQPTQAQDLSPGCQFIDEYSDGPSAGISIFFLSFNAGETIAFTAEPPTFGAVSTTITLSIAVSIEDTASYPGPVSYTFPTGGTFRVDVFLDTGEATLTGSCSAASGGNNDSDDTPTPVFTDGRINDFDSAAPLVVYPYQNEQTGDGFEVYSDEGVAVALITGDMIAAAGVSEDENLILASVPELGIYVLRLRDGSFQVQGLMENGKTYVLIFDQPYAGIGHTSFEVEPASDTP